MFRVVYPRGIFHTATDNVNRGRLGEPPILRREIPLSAGYIPRGISQTGKYYQGMWHLTQSYIQANPTGNNPFSIANVSIKISCFKNTFSIGKGTFQSVRSSGSVAYFVSAASIFRNSSVSATGRLTMFSFSSTTRKSLSGFLIITVGVISRLRSSSTHDG